MLDDSVLIETVKVQVISEGFSDAGVSKRTPVCSIKVTTLAIYNVYVNSVQKHKTYVKANLLPFTTFTCPIMLCTLGVTKSK
jgi:hypothetical protein